MNTSETAIFFSHKEPFRLQHLPIPPLKPGEILVRNEYTTLCRSDINTYCGKRFEPVPTILGHEITGRIADFGSAENPADERGHILRKGDRISWAIFASDPESELSLAGIPQKGKGLFKYGHERLTEENVLHGGLSQYTLLRPHTPVVKIEENIPLPVAAIINCAVATAAGALRVAGDVKGKNVLISGAGMLGVIACAMSKTRGANHVAAMDISRERVEAAKSFGADTVFLSGENLSQEVTEILGKTRPFHVAIDMSGANAAMEQSLELLTIGGTAVWIGATFPQPDVQISAEKLIRSILTIKGLHNYNREDLVSAVQFVEQFHTAFPFESLIQGGFSLKQVNEAFRYGLEANPFRVGIEMT